MVVSAIAETKDRPMSLISSATLKNLGVIGLPSMLPPKAQDRSTRFHFRPQLAQISCDELGSLSVLLEGPRILATGRTGRSEGMRTFFLTRSAEGVLGYDLGAGSLDAGDWLLEVVQAELDRVDAV